MLPSLSLPPVGQPRGLPGGALLRLAGGNLLLFAIAAAARLPEMPVWLVFAALAIAGLSAWRPAAVLPWIVFAAPFGEVAAGVPVRATATLFVAFFAGWLLRVHEPLDPGRRVPRTVALPALVFGAFVLVSWASIVAERSAGLPLRAFAGQFLSMLEYLATAGRDPQTAAALHLLLAIGVCLSVSALSGHDNRLPHQVAAAVVAGGLVAAAASAGGVLLSALQAGDPALLTRHLTDARVWRYSAHLDDVNAAGSHIVLASLVAFAFAGTHGRALAVSLAVLFLALPALWLTASRTALVALAAGAGVWVVMRALDRRPPAFSWLTPRTALAASAALTLALAGSLAWMGTQRGDPGLSLRQGFTVTSARMISTEPIFGVGVGRYYDRSPEFMPPSVLDAYPGGENAHNYVAQVAAELGLPAVTVFVWWLAAVMYTPWRAMREGHSPRLAAALLAGLSAYLLTCLTGHPLLVMEASVPFWAACAAAAATKDRR